MSQQFNWFESIIENLCRCVLLTLIFISAWVILLGPSFEWLIHYHKFIQSYSGGIAIITLTIFCLLFPMRNRFREFTLSHKGLNAKMEEISHQQGEVKKLGMDLMELTIRISENSGRWAGWTPREISKVEDTVHNLADFLHVSRKESERIFAPKTRWNLIDQAEQIFDSFADNHQKELGNSLNEIKQNLQNEWAEKDIVSSETLEDTIKQLPLDDLEKSILPRKIAQYRVEVNRSVFGKEKGTS